MELVDKTFTMEENQQEYFDRCEDLFQIERNFIKSILRQCSKENLVEHFALYGNMEH